MKPHSCIMKHLQIKKITAVLLSLVLMLPVLAALPLETGAANGLSAAQEQFLAQMGELASHEMERTRVLASVTVAQAIWESGWGQSSLTKKTNNYFGMTVGSSWKGTIYCSKNDSFYSSRTEAISILGNAKYNYWASGGDNRVPGFWRVYSSMAESVADHNDLLSTSGLYKGIPGETDYKTVCNILNKYYCNDGSYATAIISTIEKYDLTRFDVFSVGGDVVTDLVLDTKSLVLAVGDSHALKAAVYPSSAKDKTVTYTSSDTSVVTVSAAGVIRAVGTGTATVTAKTSNGITAEIAVYCSRDGEKTYKGTIIKSVYCRTSKSGSAQRIGVFSNGTEVMLHGESDDGTWCYVSGKNQSGELISGYIYLSCVGGITEYTDPAPVTAKYTGEITADVNVRSTPDASVSDNKLDVFGTGTKVIIYGEKDGEFYFASGTGKNGNNITGYVYAVCIKITGEFSSGDQKFAGDDGINYRFATITSAVNCRKGPTIDYERLGTFAGGATVIVCGDGVSGAELDGTWYYVKGLDKDGNAVTGYCGGDYVRLGSPVLESAAVTVSEQYAEGIASGTTPVSLASMLPGLDITVTNANGDVLDSNKPIGTGCTVTAAYKNMSLLAKTVIIRGDVDGDGKVSASDYLRVRRYILGTMELDGLFENAADVDGDGKVNAADYIRIRRAILGM